MDSITESTDYQIIIKSLRSQGILAPAEEEEPPIDSRSLQPSRADSREPSQTTTPLPVSSEVEQNGQANENGDVDAASAPTEAQPSLSTTPAPATTQTSLSNLPPSISDESAVSLDFTKVLVRVREFNFDSKRQFLTEVFRVLNNIAEVDSSDTKSVRSFNKLEVRASLNNPNIFTNNILRNQS